MLLVAELSYMRVVWFSDGMPWKVLVVGLTFAAIVWGVRAATPWAAAVGALLCFAVMLGNMHFDRSLLRSGLSPLITLFGLTWSATRMGRTRKDAQGLGEPRTGRRAAQVVANLGMAGLISVGTLNFLLDRTGPQRGLIAFSGYAIPLLVLATLVEATADTVSSEIGQAFGGTPWLLTTLRRVPRGTDGAVTLVGTLAGVGAGAMVAGVGWWALMLHPSQAGVAFVAGTAGLFFDSLLGATVERRGWLGNDLVNFLSTAFAAGVALVLLLLLGSS